MHNLIASVQLTDLNTRVVSKQSNQSVSRYHNWSSQFSSVLTIEDENQRFSCTKNAQYK